MTARDQNCSSFSWFCEDVNNPPNIQPSGGAVKVASRNNLSGYNVVKCQTLEIHDLQARQWHDMQKNRAGCEDICKQFSRPRTPLSRKYSSQVRTCNVRHWWSAHLSLQHQDAGCGTHKLSTRASVPWSGIHTHKSGTRATTWWSGIRTLRRNTDVGHWSRLGRGYRGQKINLIWTLSWTKNDEISDHACLSLNQMP